MEWKERPGPGPGEETDVAIAGAGPVGLALALELGQRGIPCTVIEPRTRRRLVPRAKLANVRTMEHLRRWGIADEVRAATPLPAKFSTEIAFVTSLRGHEITRFSNVFFTGEQRDERYSEAALQIPQYILEPVLRRQAAELASVTLMEGWHVERFVQDDDAVNVVVQGTDERSMSLRAKYLVGCDGAASTVRERLGIPMVGRRGIARNYGVVFRAPELGRLLRFAPALHFWTVNAMTPSYMGPADRDGLWWLQATAIDEAIDMDALDPLEVVLGAVGTPTEVTIINVDPWEAHALSAQRLREGRVFLAGDAAHLHSPMGAHGMNQGIADSVDLGWKLSAVLEGWGHPDLLDSYAEERSPLHTRVIEEATRNYGSLANHFVRPGLDEPGPVGERARRELARDIQRDKRREFFSLGLVLGHVYEGSSIVVPDGSPASPSQVERFASAARPGARTPHAWLRDDSSLFDRLGSGFTLLRLDSDVDPARIEFAAAERGVPLVTATIEEPAVSDLYGHRLALIRPDQVLAWHGDTSPPDPGAMLDVATGRPAHAKAAMA